MIKSEKKEKESINKKTAIIEKPKIIKKKNKKKYYDWNSLCKCYF